MVRPAPMCLPTAAPRIKVTGVPLEGRIALLGYSSFTYLNGHIAILFAFCWPQVGVRQLFSILVAAVVNRC